MTLRKGSPDDAPPPYTPSDPLTPTSGSLSVQGEPFAQSPNYSIQPADNFISAAPYFNERPSVVPHGPDEEILEHTITIYTRSQAKDYSRFPRCWRSRAAEASKHDWATFLNYLLPSHLGPASNHPDLPRKLRREIARDHKDRPQEANEERKARISAVVDEWNVHFFGPRAMRVAYVFPSESGTTTISPLCPNCYPSTVRSMPLRTGGAHPTLSRSQTAPPASQHGIPRKPVGENAADPTPVRPYQPHTENEADTNQGNRPQIAQHQSPFGSWASAIVNWANNFSEQAQRYGEHIEQQAEAHGKRVEESAESFGRMMEAKGQAWENYFEQQGNRFERATEQFEKACNRRSPWSYRSNPSGPWGAGAGRGGCSRRGGMGPYWSNSGCPMSSRPRSGSISSLSSSSSSFSDSLSSSSSSDSEHSDNETSIKSEMNSLRESRTQARNLNTEHRAKVAALRHEMGALRAAHRELRSSSRCGPGRGANSREMFNDKVAEARAIKAEMGNLKQEYKAMRNEFRQEKKQLRRMIKSSKKEHRKARKAERKQQRGKGVKGQEVGTTHNPANIAPPTSSLPTHVPVPPCPPMSPPPAYSSPFVSEPPVIPTGLTQETRTETEETDIPPMQNQQAKPEDNSTKSSKGKGKSCSKEQTQQTMSWGYTSSNAVPKSSGFWKKSREAEAPSVQWSGDGKQEIGVLPVDDEEREDSERDNPPQGQNN
ncbi:uncharacterized protein CIMG_11899 [Coccidioides immitis RS]|uniref:Uncharacterized protein n=1 Tax=Coccidioides immitis (strain RS) TaxID=246410 RepID=J3K9M7_COCIM|nr:uncharacterized protein CIMG_11899 [Coccidioides immitis RS]EAS31626.3 hypothetical protein CIMG_11899 [Coccidioides immitis RS]